MKSYIHRLFFVIPLILGLCSCNKNVSEDQGIRSENQLKINYAKAITLDISGGFPKLQGNPIFFSDENDSYFYIQTANGIGTFDLQKGGKPISMLKLSEIENFRGGTSTAQNHFLPVSKNEFLYFDRINDEIYEIENSKVTASQKMARIMNSSPKPQSGFLKFAIKEENIVTPLNVLEIYARPPYNYQKLENTIGIFKNSLKEFDSEMLLPEKYLGNNVNAYDMLISFDYDPKSNQFIINYPILDDLLITSDFESIERIKATPKSQFVDLTNRSGEKMGEWKKEYYSSNSFFAVYYDPFRELYVRHYREALSEVDYESLAANSFKMLDPRNKNYLLFLDKSGNEMHTMDVSDYNHLYIHFGKEGMYILNDTELENEDSLTFSLFTINKN
ncbi:hypothetical protein SAMN04489724_1985 [Algoriphagus locisalis]|uniref:DUF4221 domain-containing protein n=1 Tax=Algoriphagus locisalis TaxID=305507 RepID=A0A1I7AI73_9BACT|nr:hypothetical protein [Algoriphagus locisalis]SFT74608.1 hypothetical protein SAMN04489724_1985 [Algoriphagus locisalis]